MAVEFPGVASHYARQPLRHAIRGNVVELVEGHVGDVSVFHAVERDDKATPGAAPGGADAAGGGGPGGDDPAAPVITEEAGGSVPLPG